MAVFVAAMAVSLLAAGNQTAQATGVMGPTPLSCNVTEDVWGAQETTVTLRDAAVGAADALWVSGDLPESGGATYYELYGTRGTTWSYTSWWAQSGIGDPPGPERSCSPADSLVNQVANALFSASKSITSMTISIRRAATDATPFLDMLREMGATIDEVRVQIFIPGSVIMMMLTGMWVITKARDGQTRVVASGIAWAFAAVLIVTWLLLPSSTTTSAGRPVGNYFAVAQNANSAASDVVDVFSNLLLADDSDLCAPHGGGFVPASSAGSRTLDCTIWRTLVFEPWASGQFGGTGAREAIQFVAPDPGTDQGKGYTGTPFAQDNGDVRLAQLRVQSGAQPATPYAAPTNNAIQDQWDSTTRMGQWNQVRAFMWTHKNSQYRVWSGGDPGYRLSVATSTLFASVLVGAFSDIVSLLTMMWYAIPVLLLVLLPLVGTLSIFPPWQKHLRGLLQLWLKAITLAMVFSAVQIFAMMLMRGALAAPVPLGWKCLILTVYVMGLFKVLKMAREDAFTPNLGGGESARTMDPDQMRRDATSNMRSAYYTAAMVGGVVAGRAGRRGGSRGSRPAPAGGGTGVTPGTGGGTGPNQGGTGGRRSGRSSGTGPTTGAGGGSTPGPTGQTAPGGGATPTGSGASGTTPAAGSGRTPTSPGNPGRRSSQRPPRPGGGSSPQPGGQPGPAPRTGSRPGGPAPSGTQPAPPTGPRPGAGPSPTSRPGGRRGRPAGSP